MARKLRMPTLWEVPDELWTRIELILDEKDPIKSTGRPKADRRRVLDGIIFRLRTGTQWNHIPKVYGDDSTIHRYFQKWVESGVFEKIWAMLVEEGEKLGKVNWRWQSADSALGKARLGGDEIGPNPTDRAKNGTQRSLLVEAKGGPLAVVVAPANVHDTKLLSETLKRMVVDRPNPKREPQNLCLDKAYDNPTGQEAVQEHRYIGHIRLIGEGPTKSRRHPARRWVVERTLAWLSKCRAILVRYEKKAQNYLGLIQLACALLWYRRLAYAGF
jgi:putative transposase